MYCQPTQSNGSYRVLLNSGKQSFTDTQKAHDYKEKIHTCYLFHAQGIKHHLYADYSQCFHPSSALSTELQTLASQLSSYNFHWVLFISLSLHFSYYPHTITPNLSSSL